jgi:hypothetical protein
VEGFVWISGSILRAEGVQWSGCSVPMLLCTAAVG